VRGEIERKLNSARGDGGIHMTRQFAALATVALLLGANTPAGAQSYSARDPDCRKEPQHRLCRSTSEQSNQPKEDEQTRTGKYVSCAEYRGSNCIRWSDGKDHSKDR
jgi:hypothetical protein